MSYTIEKIKKQIIEQVSGAVGQKIDKSQLEVTVPPDASLGDLAVPCFYLTKLLRRSPNQIADELQARIRPTGLIKSVQNVGPYLNFFVSSGVFGKEVLKEIARLKDKYGRGKLGEEKVMIEFSQPNTHKEFHIGHVRNAVLGDSLVKLNKFAGRKVVAVNYIGDIGAHVAKCLWALKKFHQQEEPPKNKGKFLGQIYTEAVRKIESNPQFKREADEVLQKLERGDKKMLALWQKTRKWSLVEFEAIYKTLGIKFDQIFYESEVEQPGKKIVEKLLKDGLAEKSEGAVIINLEKYNLKNFLLLKSDGSSLYSTKDLALAELKFKKFKIDKSVVVVDSRQTFYLQQLFKTLEVIGFKKKMEHIAYEFVTLKDGAMSSRAGNVVLFEDFFEEMKALAKNETKKRHENWPAKKISQVARQLTLSAVKFNMLKISNSSIIVFDKNEALSFEGFTGPYLQYTLSRIASLLKKSQTVVAANIDYSKLNSDLEKEIILKLAELPEVIKRATATSEPSELAKYLFDLSRLFSNFYQSLSILTAEEKTKKARLTLVVAVRQVLVNGLNLLGLEALEQM
ncbi:MAG: arginine--tRNA ligase [Patescibacteria group bacterium]